MLDSADRGNPVIVVGAGPAGCATAIALRRSGVPVVVLDRARFPRDKVCGDVLLPEAHRALIDLGLDAAEIERHAYSCVGARYVATNGKEIDGVFYDVRGERRPWHLVKRIVFDEWLMRRARAAGAEIREGWSVRGVIRNAAGTVTGVHAETPDGEVRTVPGCVVAGADGAGSVVARELGLFSRHDDHTSVAVRTYAKGVSLPAPYVEVFTTGQTLPGGAWIVPVGKHECNVGVGVLKRDRCNLAELFNEIRERIPGFRARLAGAHLGPFQGWMLPGASQKRPLSGAGFVLVGDAGAMVDPFTGHGIHCALIAGRIAGDVLASAARTGDISAERLYDYERQYRALLGEELDTGFALQRAHSHRALVNVLLRAGAVHAGVAGLFVSLLGHAGSRRELLSKRHLARMLLVPNSFRPQ